MSLEITGTFMHALQEVKGTSAKGDWIKQEFVIETSNDKFPKKVCFLLWGDKTAVLKNLKPGTPVKVSFNLESREFNGRWYTDARAWQVVELTGNTPNQNTMPAEQAPAETSHAFIDQPAGETSAADDLPF